MSRVPGTDVEVPELVDYVLAICESDDIDARSRCADAAGPLAKALQVALGRLEMAQGFVLPDGMEIVTEELGGERFWCLISSAADDLAYLLVGDEMGQYQPGSQEIRRFESAEEVFEAHRALFGG